MSAAGTLNLNCDIVNKVLVYSTISGTPFLIPSVTQGDTVPVIVKVLQFQGILNQFATPVIDGMGLQFTLCDVDTVDVAGSTAFVSQFSWTKDTPLKQFSADIAFTTSALNTWLAGASSKTGCIRLKLTEGTNTTEIYRANVKVYAGSTATLTTPPTETPLSLERALATFVPKVQTAGDYEIKVSPDGSKFRHQVYNDGQPHWDPIT